MGEFQQIEGGGEGFSGKHPGHSRSAEADAHGKMVCEWINVRDHMGGHGFQVCQELPNVHIANDANHADALKVVANQSASDFKKATYNNSNPDSIREASVKLGNDVAEALVGHYPVNDQLKSFNDALKEAMRYNDVSVSLTPDHHIEVNVKGGAAPMKVQSTEKAQLAHIAKDGGPQ